MTYFFGIMIEYRCEEVDGKRRAVLRKAYRDRIDAELDLPNAVILWKQKYQQAVEEKKLMFNLDETSIQSWVIDFEVE